MPFGRIRLILFPLFFLVLYMLIGFSCSFQPSRTLSPRVVYRKRTFSKSERRKQPFLITLTLQPHICRPRMPSWYRRPKIWWINPELSSLSPSSSSPWIYPGIFFRFVVIFSPERNPERVHVWIRFNMNRHARFMARDTVEATLQSRSEEGSELQPHPVWMQHRGVRDSHAAPQNCSFHGDDEMRGNFSNGVGRAADEVRI